MSVDPNAPLSTQTGTVPGPRGSTSPTGDQDMKERAQEAAGTAKDEGAHLGHVAKEEAGNVVEEAKQQGRNLLDEARTQVDEQSRGQRDKLVSMLQGLSDDLEQMTSNAPQGLARDLGQQLAGKARDFGNRMDGREPGDMLDDVRRFARQRPGTFLLGAAVAGVLAGRFARGAKQARDDSSGGGMDSQLPVATGRATTLPPVPPPVAPPSEGLAPGPVADPVAPVEPVDPLLPGEVGRGPAPGSGLAPGLDDPRSPR